MKETEKMRDMLNRLLSLVAEGKLSVADAEAALSGGIVELVKDTRELTIREAAAVAGDFSLCYKIDYDKTHNPYHDGAADGAEMVQQKILSLLPVAPGGEGEGEGE